MNQVILIGRLTKDPELKYTPGSGTAVANFTIAVDNYNSKTQEKKADFIPVVVWGKQAENASQYISKGSMVAVNGRISVRSYDAKDGSKRYITEIVAAPLNGITFLSKNNKENNQQVVNGDVFGNQVFGDMQPVDDGDMPF